MYGLKQSGRNGLTLHAELIYFGFSPFQAHPCLCTLGRGREKIILGLYVDDIRLAYSCKDILGETIKYLTSKFEMKDLGEAKKYVGIEIEQNEGQIKLKQEKYINKLLVRFGMEECKTVRTLIEPYLKLQKEDNCNTNLYQNLIGALMFLVVATRSDISYAVSYLSQFNNCYEEEHFKYGKRLLRYLKGTKETGLLFKKNNKPIIN